MDNVKRAIFVASLSKKWTDDSGKKNFLIKRFYRQGSKSMWIGYHLLGSSYFPSANQDYKV